MDQFNVISLFGSDHRVLVDQEDPSKALQDLDRRSRHKHFRHLVNWVLRVAVCVSAISVGIGRAGDHWGDILSVIAAIALMHSLIFAAKGHWKISNFRKARRYWLQDAGSQSDMYSAEIVEEEAGEESLKTHFAS